MKVFVLFLKNDNLYLKESKMELTKKTIIGVIGSGAMGTGIAQVAATSGYKVILYDNNEKAIDKAGSCIDCKIDN